MSAQIERLLDIYSASVWRASHLSTLLNFDPDVSFHKEISEIIERNVETRYAILDEVKELEDRCARAEDRLRLILKVLNHSKYGKKIKGEIEATILFDEMVKTWESMPEIDIIILEDEDA
jgi:predicted DNA-binding protein YlxM (UPF0122 family)